MIPDPELSRLLLASGGVILSAAVASFVSLRKGRLIGTAVGTLAGLALLVAVVLVSLRLGNWQ
jgi:hypothetical protein